MYAVLQPEIRSLEVAQKTIPHAQNLNDAITKPLCSRKISYCNHGPKT